MSLFSGKDTGLMAVDVSSTAIKLVELSKSRSGYALKSMAIVPLPRDAIVENTVIDSMAVSQALLDAVDIARPSTRRIAFAISGNSVIIKTAQVANMSEFDFESEVDFEADQHIPYDIDDVYLDFQILGPCKDDPEQMDVVLTACKREIVDDYQLVMGEAGLETVCVDCAVFALENAAELMGAAETDMVESFEDEAEYAVALVNIGANLININILKNGTMAFVRDQFYGGMNLTEEIQKEHVLGFQAAEEMKINRFTEVSPEAIERFYMGLTSEIVRSLDFYAANNSESPVQAIYLSGGGALLPGMAEELNQRLGIETHMVNPFGTIKVNPKKFDLEYLERIGPMMVVPIGLALRSFDV